MRHRGQSLALPTVVFGYVGGAALPADSRKVDRSILIVAESGDFLGRSNSLSIQKPCVSDGSGDGNFQGEKNFLQRQIKQLGAMRTIEHSNLAWYCLSGIDYCNFILSERAKHVFFELDMFERIPEWQYSSKRDG